MSRYILVPCWLGLYCLLACAEGADPRFVSPAATFRTYRQALSEGDGDAAWSCLSRRHRERDLAGDLAAWRTSIAGEEGRRLAREVARREISEERRINDRVAYLQFDPSTVPEGEGPFYYFLRDPDGWKITTHTDSLFRAELEAAIESGQYRLTAR